MLWHALCFLYYYYHICIFALSFILSLSHTLFLVCLSPEFIIHNRWLNTSVTSGSFVFVARSFSLSLSVSLSLHLPPLSVSRFLCISFYNTYSWAQLSISRRCIKLKSAFHLTAQCMPLSLALLLSLSVSLRNSFHFAIFRYFTRCGAT